MNRPAHALRTALAAILILSLLLPAAVLYGCGTRSAPALFTDTLPTVDPDPEVHVRVTASGEPDIVYAPCPDATGYRYGPTIMYYADGSCDAWFSCNGNLGEWDWISYKHSKDGKTFGTERVVLTPTPDSRDKYSCCDPGAVYFGGYYYIGYTSTIESTGGGVNNNVFVARSHSPAGPYEKWNGSGWGGEPEPIVYYDEYDLKYGAGEPSMVVVDNVLYVYYTWACPEGNYAKVATSDTAEDWPARLTYQGIAYTKAAQDSIDVAYLEDAGKFVAFATQNRFSEKSGIAVLESDDGLHFTQTDFICEGLYQYCHNMGIARRPDGHIQLKDNIFVGYAFSNGGSSNWGKWATAFQPVTFELYRGDVTPSPATGSVFCDGYFDDPDSTKPMIGFSASERIIELFTGDDRHSVLMLWFDSALQSHFVKDVRKVRFYGYDSSLIGFDGNVVRSKDRTGVTTVKASYKGHVTEFKVFVFNDYSEFRGDSNKTVAEFTPVSAVYEVSLTDRHKPQIRGLVRFSDHTWGEAFNDGEMVSYRKFPVTYEVADPAVAAVSDRGIITPLSAGTTEVKVTIAGTDSFTVRVVVRD